MFDCHLRDDQSSLFGRGKRLKENKKVGGEPTFLLLYNLRKGECDISITMIVYKIQIAELSKKYVKLCDSFLPERFEKCIGKAIWQ